MDIYVKMVRSLIPKDSHELKCLSGVSLSYPTAVTHISYKDDFLNEMFDEMEKIPIEFIKLKTATSWIYKQYKRLRGDAVANRP